MTDRHPDALAAVRASLDADPFRDPVVFRGRLLPRDRARALERHLLDVRREVATANENDTPVPEAEWR